MCIIKYFNNKTHSSVSTNKNVLFLLTKLSPCDKLLLREKLMKFFQKLKSILNERKMTALSLKQEIDWRYKKPISYNTLLRILRGEVEPRANSLHQICGGLRISMAELLGGTELEISSGKESEIADIIRKNDHKSKYAHTTSDHTYHEVLIDSKYNFLPVLLNIYPKEKTKLMEDPIEEGKFFKWVYVLQGTLDAYIGNEHFVFKGGDAFSFQSTIPHYFENKASLKPQKKGSKQDIVRCILVQNPKYI